MRSRQRLGVCKDGGHFHMWGRFTDLGCTHEGAPIQSFPFPPEVLSKGGWKLPVFWMDRAAALKTSRAPVSHGRPPSGPGSLSPAPSLFRCCLWSSQNQRSSCPQTTPTAACQPLNMPSWHWTCPPGTDLFSLPVNSFSKTQSSYHNALNPLDSPPPSTGQKLWLLFT